MPSFGASQEGRERGVGILSASNPFPFLTHSKQHVVKNHLHQLKAFGGTSFGISLWGTSFDRLIGHFAHANQEQKNTYFVPNPGGKKTQHKMRGQNEELPTNHASFQNKGYCLRLKCLQMWYPYVCALTTRHNFLGFRQSGFASWLSHNLPVQPVQDT